MRKSSGTYVLDSHPLLTYFKLQPGWEEVELLLSQSREADKKLLLSLINWGEVYYSILADRGEEDAERMERIVEDFPIEIVAPDFDMTRQAAIFKSQGGISYADCFAAALAVKENAILVTGDPEFKKLEKKGYLKIKWI